MKFARVALVALTISFSAYGNASVQIFQFNSAYGTSNGLFPYIEIQSIVDNGEPYIRLDLQWKVQRAQILGSWQTVYNEQGKYFTWDGSQNWVLGPGDERYTDLLMCDCKRYRSRRFSGTFFSGGGGFLNAYQNEWEPTDGWTYTHSCGGGGGRNDCGRRVCDDS